MTRDPDARPGQAVIFAGGAGERMRPLTDLIPKPMIEFHGRPFLDYLVEELRDQGLTRILLLLGYRADVIQRRFGDGTDLGVRISYSVTAPEDETGRRLALARDRLEPVFMVLYGDNYWPLQLDRMWSRFREGGEPAMVTVYRNRDGLTRNNVRVDDTDHVVAYDPSRTAPDLNGVEIGYTIVSQRAVASLSDANVSFGRAVLAPLVDRHELLAYPTEHRYYGIGAIDRLPRASAFLARTPTVLLDRDGVLNRRPARAEYVRKWEEFEWLPGALEALRLFTQRGYRVIVVTNQPGVARGALTASELDAIHERMRAEAAGAGGRIERVYSCPHNWDEGCECRKPKPGMLLSAQRDFELDLTRTWMIGDDERDEAAATAAGSPARLVSDSMTVLDHAREILA
jgi:histidinol-phosphate phosphatase family protein